ncbi:MAG: DedA family protein [Campylobacteraceae bacterium]|nr:DedA family protein [Campylobacteraceae bacterium]
MEEMLTSLSTYGYIVLFFYSLGGGMIALIAAGVLSYAGKMDLGFVIVIAAIANFIGDTMLFYLSRYSKKEIMPYFSKQKRNLALAQILFKKHGAKIMFVKKYVYGLKTLVPLAIGLTKYPFAKFSVINFVSAVIWAVSVALASYYAGDFLMEFFKLIKAKPWIMPIVLLAIVGLIVLYFKQATKRKA